MFKAKEEVFSIQKLVNERLLQIQYEEHELKISFIRDEHEKKMRLLELQIFKVELEIKLCKSKLEN